MYARSLILVLSLFLIGCDDSARRDGSSPSETVTIEPKPEKRPTLPPMQKLAKGELPVALLPQPITTEEEWTQARKEVEEQQRSIEEISGLRPTEHSHVEKLPDCLLSVDIDGDGWTKFYANGNLRLHRIRQDKSYLNLFVEGYETAAFHVSYEPDFVMVTTSDPYKRETGRMTLFRVSAGEPYTISGTYPVWGNQSEVEDAVRKAFDIELKLKPKF